MRVSRCQCLFNRRWEGVRLKLIQFALMQSRGTLDAGAAFVFHEIRLDNVSMSSRGSKFNKARCEDIDTQVHSLYSPDSQTTEPGVMRRWAMIVAMSAAYRICVRCGSVLVHSSAVGCRTVTYPFLLWLYSCSGAVTTKEKGIIDYKRRKITGGVDAKVPQRFVGFDEACIQHQGLSVSSSQIGKRQRLNTAVFAFHNQHTASDSSHGVGESTLLAEQSDLSPLCRICGRSSCRGRTDHAAC